MYNSGMEMRLQTINDDTVLEITQPGEMKTRLSEKTLLRRKGYLTEMIVKCQLGLDDVNASLALIYNEQEKQAKGE